MFKKFSLRIVSEFVEEKIISCDEREVYEYGIEQGLYMILNYIIVGIIGMFLGTFVETLVFVLSYSFLRIFAGGYHADTPIKCLTSYVGIVTTALLFIKYYPLNIFICSLLFCFSGIVILFLAPVEDNNKPLDDLEKKVYRQRTYIVLAIESFMFILSGLFSLKWINFPITLAVVSIAFLTFIGKIKSKIINFNDDCR